MRNTFEIKPGLSFVRAGEDPIAAKKAAARNNGTNDHSDDLQPLGPFLLANYTTFSEADFIKASASTDIPYAERSAFFAAFVKQAIKEKRIVKIPSCYEQDVFRVV